MDRDVLRARAGDQAAFRRLEVELAGLLHWAARQVFAPGLTRDDLYQEGLIGLWKAVRDYRPNANRHGFRSFAKLCIERQIITGAKTATRGKHGPLNHAVQLDQSDDDDDDHARQRDRRPELADPGPSAEERIEMRELLSELGAVITWDLSELEREAVLRIAVNGDSYESAGAELGVSVKVIDNALTRVRRKLAEWRDGDVRCVVCGRRSVVARCGLCVEELRFRPEDLAA